MWFWWYFGCCKHSKILVGFPHQVTLRKELFVCGISEDVWISSNSHQRSSFADWSETILFLWLISRMGLFSLQQFKLGCPLCMGHVLLLASKNSCLFFYLPFCVSKKYRFCLHALNYHDPTGHWTWCLHSLGPSSAVQLAFNVIATNDRINPAAVSPRPLVLWD